ncbi:hypothetical protein MIMGU_mgv1a020472mg, partial [Erythranthe guttata]
MGGSAGRFRVFGQHITLLVSLSFLHGKDRKLFCGVIASLFSGIMYAAPLPSMWNAFTTRSVDFVPLHLLLLVLLTSLFWLIFGILGNDLFIMVPNGIGCTLGIIQLITYAV